MNLTRHYNRRVHPPVHTLQRKGVSLERDILLFTPESIDSGHATTVYDKITDHKEIKFSLSTADTERVEEKSAQGSPQGVLEESNSTDPSSGPACGTPNGLNSPKKSKTFPSAAPGHLWATILGRAGVKKNATHVANAHIESGKPTDAYIINNILGTQITNNQLFRLLNGPRLRFQNLSNTKEILRIIRQGSLISVKDIAGAYI